jgi:isoleucyl-tRNA synthetase
MALARTAVGLVRGLRARHEVRGRQPLQRMTVVAANEASRAALLRARELIADEINVKEVVVSGDEAEFVSYSARPNLPVLGKKYGKQLGVIKAELSALASSELAKVVQGESLPSQQIDGLVYDSSTLIVDRTSRPGTVVDTLDGVTVALDLEVTESLRLEGLAREFISRIQALRKERDLALDARIQLDVRCQGALALAISTHWDLIAGEVLAVGAVPELGAGTQSDGLPGDWLRLEIEGEVAFVRVTALSADAGW